MASIASHDAKDCSIAWYIFPTHVILHPHYSLLTETLSLSDNISARVYRVRKGGPWCLNPHVSITYISSCNLPRKMQRLTYNVFGAMQWLIPDQFLKKNYVCGQQGDPGCCRVGLCWWQTHIWRPVYHKEDSSVGMTCKRQHEGEWLAADLKLLI